MALIAFASHAQSTLTNGLVAYYPFDGNVNDASGNENNGTIYGGVILVPDRFGSNNSAYSFNGVDGYIDIGNPVGNSPSNLTESAWVKIISRANTPYGYPPVDVIITKRETRDIGSGWSTLGIGSGSSGQNIGEGEIIVDGDDYYDPDAGTSQTPTNVWFFICGIKSNNTYQIYINGALENIITDANTESSVEDMYLMHHGAWGAYCNGVLDDVRIYNRALSSNEVSQLYAMGAVAPTITAQPTNVTVNVGGTASFSVTAGGTQPMSYQWSFGTTNLDGAANATLTLTNVQLNQTGNYSVLVTNIAGSTNSVAAMLTVLAVPPTITTQPTNQTVQAGGSASFTVTAAGTPPLGYQWSFGTTNLDGATNATLLLTNVQLTQAGNYSVLVTNAYGSTNSANAVLSVVTTLDHFAWSTISSPQSADQPFGVTVTAENAFGVTVTNFTGSVSLRASSAGALTNSAAILNGGFETGTLTNWTLTNSAYGQFVINNGTVIPPGASGPVAPYAGSHSALGDENGPGAFDTYQDISIPSGVSAASLSWAHCVRNYFGAFNSAQGFQVRICDTNNTVLATAFTTSPGDALLGNWVQTNYDVTAFAGRTVRVMFWVDSGSYYIDAYVDNVSLQLAAGISIAPTNSGSFVNGVWSGNITVPQPATNVVLTANDGSGHAGSSNPFDVVLSPPVITTQPTNQTVFVGQPASFSVTASGTAPISYQWSFGTTNLDGATNATLTLTNVQLNQTGNYSVLVTNIAGSTNSVAAMLTVNTPPPITTTMTGANLQLAWPVSSGTFQLQSADSVLGPWNIVQPLTVVTNGANATVTVTATNNQQYFRLIGQ
ncbi:MAG TPA: immunoglobulin domain-containing protein [Verrucomicrobiae bacterium]